MRQNRPRKLTETQELALVRRYSAGERCESIARDFGVHWVTVHNIAKRLGMPRPRIAPTRTPAAWIIEARRLYELGVKCSLIGHAVGVADETVQAKAVSDGWQRQSAFCNGCGSDVPVRMTGNREMAQDRKCLQCTAARHRVNKANRRRNKPEAAKEYHQRYKAKLHAEGKRTPRDVLQAQRNQFRAAARNRSPQSQRGRFIRSAEPPVNRAGALLILQATLTKLLAVRCNAEGVSRETMRYRARYAVDPQFRERERQRTSGKRWINRADHRDDGTLCPKTIRRLFAQARKCPYCWQPMRSADKSLDHMEPLSLGGWHSIQNVLVCCRRCNSRKSNRPWAEWISTIPAACAAALVARAA